MCRVRDTGQVTFIELALDFEATAGRALPERDSPQSGATFFLSRPSLVSPAAVSIENAVRAVRRAVR